MLVNILAKINELPVHHAWPFKNLVSKESVKKIIQENGKFYGYSFWEGDKGVVFAATIEEAEEKLLNTYGKEYIQNHKLSVDLCSWCGEGVCCFEDTWK